PSMTADAAAGPASGSRLVDALLATSQEFAKAVTLPGAVFHSGAVFRFEQQLLASAWHPVAREEDLPAPGAYRRVEVDGQPLLLTRDDAGEAHAHYNVCVHRGSRLVDATSGKASQLRCPYHAWCYDLAGKLTHAPRQCDDSPRALRRVRLARWGGYLLLNLDDDAPDLSTAWHDLPDCSAYRMASLRRAHREVYEVRANWKLLCENYSECYHCPGAHPQLARISDYVGDGHKSADGVSSFGACFNGGPMALREGVGTMSMTGRSRLPIIESVPEADRHLVYYYVIYPNLFLSLHPDYVLLHMLTPIAPDRTRVTCDWLVHPQALGAREAIADVVDFWHLTNVQDWQLCERNHAGVVSRGYVPGPYHESEQCVHGFDAWYAGTLARALPPSSAGEFAD
ncbi:MAG: aromatic ring-hydroxylating dioxygenase subunit alpha, partial [Pseudomonadota bacterium]